MTLSEVNVNDFSTFYVASIKIINLDTNKKNAFIIFFVNVAIVYYVYART